MAVRWGMVGCGDVAEVKSGPGFYKASGSTLAAVMRRDRALAEDYARRHGVPVVHARAQDLVADPGVDAVYIATPPASHCELALLVAAAAKPCLVEKPMAMNHAECVRMVDAFERAGVPLWVAYYRRALPRFLFIRSLLADGTIGQVTSLHLEVLDVLATGARARAWRYDPAIAGAGLFLDLASHGFDLLDFLGGPIAAVSGFAVNTGGSYAAEDATVAAFEFASGAVGTGAWNFNAACSLDRLTLRGSRGDITTSLFTDADVVVARAGKPPIVHAIRNPPHVHQPLIQSIVDELAGGGRCESTGVSGARASWAMEQCVRTYYDRVRLKPDTSDEGEGGRGWGEAPFPLP